MIKGWIRKGASLNVWFQVSHEEIKIEHFPIPEKGSVSFI
jgi:hypothetical protein